MKNLNVFNISKAVGGKLYFPVDGKKPVDLDTLMMNPDGAVAFPELYGETVRTYKDIVTLYKGKEIQNAVIDNRLIEEGGLFIPIKGQKVDGHRFIEPSFAAGAMMYVVVEELIPEMSQGQHSDIGALAFAMGFSLMMVLDVALG